MMNPVPQIKVRLVREPNVTWGDSITGSSMLAPLLVESQPDDGREHFRLVLFNSRHQIIGLHTVAIGNVDAVHVDPGQLFAVALLARPAGCVAVAVTHNHPSGNPLPSPADLELTERLREAGAMLSTPLLDHVVTANGNTAWTSIRQQRPELWLP